MPKTTYYSEHRNFIITTVIVVVVLLAGIWMGTRLPQFGEAGESKYSAVYLITGDIYFGKFSMFPRPHISGAWHLDRGVDKNNQPLLGISPMKNVVWGPGNTMYLNREQIIFWSKLRSDSPLVDVLSGKQAAPAPTTGNAGAAPAPTTGNNSETPAGTSTP